MGKKIIIETIRITSSMKEEIKKLADVTGLRQSELIRHLINRSLNQIRHQCNGDYSKLEFEIKKIQ